MGEIKQKLSKGEPVKIWTDSGKAVALWKDDILSVTDKKKTKNLKLHISS